MPSAHSVASHSHLASVGLLVIHVKQGQVLDADFDLMEYDETPEVKL